jgi:CTP:molybdopterin cytidylyltransferase MocA
MGTPKWDLRLPSHGGERLIDILAEVFRAAALQPLVVVGRGLELAGVLPIEGDPELPMIDSLARAIERLPPSIEGAVIQPVDAPYTTPALVAHLTAGSVPERARVPYCAGEPGHPVLIARRLFAEIEARPEGGLRAILSAGTIDRLEVDDERILADLDTPEDIREWEP